MDNYNTPLNHSDNNSKNCVNPENIRFYNTLNLKKTYSIAGIAVLVLYATIFFAQTVMIVVATIVDPSVMYDGWFNLFATDVPIYGVAFWIFLFFMSKLTPIKPQKRSFGVGNTLAILPIACFFMIAGSLIGNGVDSALQGIFGVELGDALTETAETMSLSLQAVFLVVIAPIGEELIFRKLLMNRILVYGEGTAIMFSAVTFAIFHGNFNQLFYAFGMGLLLAYLYAKTGSYIRCVALHALVNALFGVIYPWLYDASFTSSKMEAVYSFALLVEWALILAGLVLFIVYLSCKKIKIEKTEYETIVPASKLAFLSAPFVVYSACVLFLMLISYMPR